MENIWRRRPCALSCWSALDADGCCALRVRHDLETPQAVLQAVARLVEDRQQR